MNLSELVMKIRTGKIGFKKAVMSRIVPPYVLYLFCLRLFEIAVSKESQVEVSDQEGAEVHKRLCRLLRTAVRMRLAWLDGHPTEEDIINVGAIFYELEIARKSYAQKLKRSFMLNVFWMLLLSPATFEIYHSQILHENNIDKDKLVDFVQRVASDARAHYYEYVINERTGYKCRSKAQHQAYFLADLIEDYLYSKDFLLRLLRIRKEQLQTQNILTSRWKEESEDIIFMDM